MAVSSAVIIACAVAGSIVVVGIVIKVALHIRRRINPPAPLPPARPLTMLQETPWAQSRIQQMNGSSQNLHTAMTGRLQPMEERGNSRFMYKQYKASGTEEALLRQPPSPLSPLYASGYHTEQLSPPQPMFFQSENQDSSPTGDRGSRHLSWNSATEESDPGTYPPQRHQSVSAFPDPSVMSGTEDSASANGSTPPSPMLPTSQRAKRLSGQTTSSSIRTANVASGSRSNPVPSVRSSRSLTTIRGAPHRPHSRVDIVLPTPLAPQIPEHRSQSYFERNERGLGGASSRMSVCDPWLNVGRTATAPLQTPSAFGKDGQRSRRSSEHQTSKTPRMRSSRQSVSSTSSRTASTDVTMSSFTSNSRSSSFTALSIHCPSSSTRSRKTSLDASQLPPVPRVPSMYSSYPDSRSGSAATSPIDNSALKQLPADVHLRGENASAGDGAIGVVAVAL